MFIQGPSGDRLLKRSQPYRNQRIINVIRDVYFTGGVASFATRYHRLFPRYHDSQGVTKLEVPEPMLALVATAVIYFTSHPSTSNLTCVVVILHCL